MVKMTNKNIRGNINIKIDADRIYNKVLENLSVQFYLNKKERELIKQAVETTIWELFERKEELFKDIINSNKAYKADYSDEFI